MEGKFKEGMSHEITVATTAEHSARKFFPNLPDVFATPYLGGYMERASAELIDQQLEEGWQSVGISMNLQHLAPTPLGMKVKIVTKVSKVEGRKLTFDIEAFDELEKIGVASHERFIINAAKFEERVEAKTKKWKEG